MAIILHAGQLPKRPAVSVVKRSRPKLSGRRLTKEARMVQLGSGMSKCEPLHAFLLEVEGNDRHLTFSRVEEIIGCHLPPSARKRRPWWGNGENSMHTQCRSCMKAARKVAAGGVDLAGESVHFVRFQDVLLRKKEANVAPRLERNRQSC